MATAPDPTLRAAAEDEFAAMLLTPSARDQVCGALVSGIVAHPVVETPPLTRDELVSAMNRLRAVPRYLLVYPAGPDPVPPWADVHLFKLVNGAYREMGGEGDVVE